MRENIIVIGDSLGAPRPWIGVDLRKTYAFQLNEKLGGEYFVANYSASDNSTERSIKESFLRTYLRSADASFAVIQLGIVDCAPRLLSSFERALGAVAARWSYARRIFEFYVGQKSKHRYHLTKVFPKTLVTLDQFERNYRKLIDELIGNNPIRKIYLINIAYPGRILLERSYNILNNIIEYNGVVKRMEAEYLGRIEVLDLFRATEDSPDWITEDDGHHITGNAHDWIAHHLSVKIASVKTRAAGTKCNSL